MYAKLWAIACYCAYLDICIDNMCIQLSLVYYSCLMSVVAERISVRQIIVQLWKKSSSNRNTSVSFEIDSLAMGYLKDSTEYNDKLYNTAHK